MSTLATSRMNPAGRLAALREQYADAVHTLHPDQRAAIEAQIDQLEVRANFDRDNPGGMTAAEKKQRRQRLASIIQLFLRVIDAGALGSDAAQRVAGGLVALAGLVDLDPPAELEAVADGALVKSDNTAKTGKVSPWEMTLAERSKVKEQYRVQGHGLYSYTRASGSQEVGRIENLSQLNYGVPDHAPGGHVNEGISEAERQVLIVDRAVRKGESVPKHVINEARELREKLEVTPDRLRAIYELGAKLTRSDVPDLHGGLIIAGDPSGKGSRTNVLEIPLGELRTDEARFQPRETAYSEETAQRLVEHYDRQQLDPLRVWKDPDDGEWYVLAGHSRREGQRRRLEAGLPDAGSLPAIPFEGTEAEAIAFAHTENDSGTSLTNAERAEHIRTLRDTTDLTLEDIKARAKTLYGREHTTVIALSYLSPRGKALSTLRQLTGNSSGELRDAETMAVWIGKLRRYNEALTNSHENEIHAWLLDNYKTKGKRISSFAEFREHVERVIGRRSFMGEFDADKPLNFGDVPERSRQDLEIDRQIREARAGH